MISLSLFRVTKVLFCSALALSAAQACGPDFFPDTFVRTARPDLPGEFVQGRLGLLQTGFARGDLFVAYRYLNGGALDSTEQKAWAPSYPLSEQYFGPQSAEPQANSTQESPASRWFAVRSAFPGVPAVPPNPQGTIDIRNAQGFQYQEDFLNCADDAFRTAVETLQARVASWGKMSPFLLDWLHAQDVVFSNCSRSPAVPSPAPAGSPALLVQDRAYQVAAAHFYGRNFPRAAGEFLAISQNKASPWQPGSGYLAARTLIRQAFFARLDAQDQAAYDPAIMRSAEGQLRAFLDSNPPPPWRDAAQKQLALVRIRLEPEQRARELAAVVSGPAHDANFSQDFQDLLWITSAKTPDGLRAQPERYQQVPDEAHPNTLRPATAQEIEQAVLSKRIAAFEGAVPIRSLAPILDWTLTLQSLAPSAPQHALEQWQSTHTLPWLLAALVLAKERTPAPRELLEAAGAVPVNSPAWETVTYHRIRLLIASGRAPEARSALAAFSAHLQALRAEQREPSSMNAARGLQMALASTPGEILSFAPRSLLLASSEEASSVTECREVMKHPERHYHCVAEIEPGQLDTDAADLFNQRAPLTFWLTAAKSEDLSPQLRAAIAEEGWTRSVLLEDTTAGTAFLALLPSPLHDEAVAGASPLSPWITLARNPGLRPYLNRGTQRAYSYDFVESYRDNWCYNPEPTQSDTAPALNLESAVAERGRDEARRVSTRRSVYVGRHLLETVKANLQDPQAPEALYLILRMIRYGCTEPALPASSSNTAQEYQGPPSREAQDLLQLKLDTGKVMRQHFATSPWTKKAAPFVG